jgi:hypothetical protein
MCENQFFLENITCCTICTVHLYDKLLCHTTLLKRLTYYHIFLVIVSVLDSSAVYRGFEPQSVQPNEYKIGIPCFSARSFKE